MAHESEANIQDLAPTEEGTNIVKFDELSLVSSTDNFISNSGQEQNDVANEEDLSSAQKLLTTVDTNACDVPVVDIEAIKVLEFKAKELEHNLNRMMENLTRNMTSISSTSVQYAECYRECVKNIGNATDTTTKAMANLIGKCEEMNRSMEPLYSMAEQIKTLKSLLDQFEEICK